MRLVATRRLETGMHVARDVPGTIAGGVPLLRAGVVLTPRYRDALVHAGIHAVYIDDELGEGIAVTDPISMETRREAERVVSEAFATLPAVPAGHDLPDATVLELSRVAHLIAAELWMCDDAALALTDLAGADQYTLQHSLDVAVLGLLIGRRLFRERGRIDYQRRRAFDRYDETLTRLGLGLILHDVGKLAVPSEIVHKQGPLDEDELAIMRTHPLAGLDLLRTDLIGPTSKAVVRSHHERWDGDGYPDGKAEGEIHQFARIAAVADVFDAVTSERPYASAEPQHVGFDVILDGDGTRFDPEVVEIFRKIVVPYPPGSEIELLDGRRAVVVSVPEHDPERPRIRVGFDRDGNPVKPYELELADEPDLVPEIRPRRPDRHTAQAA